MLNESYPPFCAVQPAAPLPALWPPGVPGVLGAQDGDRGQRGGGGARLRPVLRLLPLRVRTQPPSNTTLSTHAPSQTAFVCLCVCVCV